jgi:hypothetical protein
MPDQADQRLSTVPRRGLARHAVKLDAWLRDGDRRVRVKVSDLSSDGCRVEGDLFLEQAIEIWLKLEGLTPRAARVAWSCKGLAGCEFVEAVDEAAVRAVIERKLGRQPIRVVDRRRADGTPGGNGSSD